MHLQLLHPQNTTRENASHALAELREYQRQGILPNLTAFIVAYGRAVVEGGLAILNAVSGHHFSLADLSNKQGMLPNIASQYLFTALALVRRK